MKSRVSVRVAGLLVLCLLAVTAGASYPGASSSPSSGWATQGKLLGLLKPGDTVSLKQAEGAFEVNVFENVPMLNKVLSVGEDYITFQDAAEFAEITIPVYQIRCIRKVKKP
jgi:hypothetical protein